MSMVMPAGDAGASSTPTPAATTNGFGRVLLALDRVTTGMAGASACLMLAVAVACGLWQVTVRFLFNAPSEWSEVLTRFALIWMVYLGAALALRQGSMVSIDLMHRLSSGRVRTALELFIVLATIALMAVLVWFGAVVTWRVRFQEVAGLYVAMSWAYLAIPIGAAFSIVSVLAHFVDPKRLELDTAV
jgi:TRAP-type C4-dicarboxylate transport system permease small subunit